MIIVIIISTISPLREMKLEVAPAISLVPPHEVHFELHTPLVSSYIVHSFHLT